MADLGSNLCRPALAYAVAQLPEPSFTVETDGHVAARLAFELGELPAGLYEPFSLSYHFDMGQNSSELRAGSECGRHWSRHGARSYVAVLTYGDLAGACGLAVTFNEDNVTRSGFVAALLIASPTQPGEEAFVVQRWPFRVAVAFPTRVHALQHHLLASAERTRPGGSVLTGPVPASLRLFASAAFERPKAVASYREGERAFLSLALAEDFAAAFNVAVTAVWLSRSDASSAPAVHELSGSMEALESPSGQGALASVVMRACVDCWMHVNGSLSSPGRRLGEDAGAAHAAVAVTVLRDADAAGPSGVTAEGPSVNAQGCTEEGCGVVVDSGGMPEWQAAFVAIIAAAVSGIIAWIGVHYRRSRKHRRVSPMGPSLSPVTDPKIVQTFEEVMRRAVNFKKGADLRFGRSDPPTSSIRLLHAWEIHSPYSAGEYMARKSRVEQEVTRVAAGRTVVFPTVCTELTDLQTVPIQDLADGVNEVMLLHGTSSELLLTIAFNGVSEKFTSTALFGKGVYLAENAAKTDQYSQPLEPGDTKAGADELRKQLFSSCGLPVPTENCFFIIVCTAILGCPAHTKDSSTTTTGSAMSLPAGGPVFATVDKTELAEFPGFNPSIRAHSLIAETGGLIARFREFVIFNAQGILPRYVLAYARVN